MKFPANEVAPYLNEERHGKYAKLFSGPAIVIRSKKQFATSLSALSKFEYDFEWNRFDEEDEDDNLGYITYAMYFTSGSNCFCPSPVNLSFGVLTAFEI